MLPIREVHFRAKDGSHDLDQAGHSSKRHRQARTFQERLIPNRGIRLRDHEGKAVQGGFGQDIGVWQLRREKQESQKGEESSDWQ